MSKVYVGRFIFLAILFLPLFTLSQNLISNPGFEQNSGLPVGIGQWQLATGWTNAEGGISFPSPTPDYLHVDAAGSGRLPQTPFGVISPHEGNAVMGASLWSQNRSDFREFISRQLSAPLTVGTTYACSFYLSNGKQGPGTAGGYGISGLGVHFSVEAPVQSGARPLAVDPQYTVSEVLYSQDWQLVLFTFVATAPYQYITLGNFQDDTHTRARLFSGTTFPGAYYFFDSFVLNVYDPEEEIEEVFPITAGADTLDQLATETFVEEETPCNFYLPNAFSPDGNGINEYFELYSPCVPLALSIHVFDSSGQVVFISDEPHFRWDGYYNGKPVEPGIYVYIIHATFPESEGVRNKVWRGALRVKPGS